VENVAEENMRECKRNRKRISFFGHFGKYNFGNESTLQAILYNLHRHLPDAEITCICTGPEDAARIHEIKSIPISGTVIKPWAVSNPLVRLTRKVLIGIPSELSRWLKAFWTLKDMNMLIIPGTGLLTDAYGFFHWGPYNMFKWSLVAKLCRCKLLFVSVGAGPVYTSLGRWFIKSALALADYRSYRDHSTMKYLKGIGIPTNTDRIYPDLAFSLPEPVIPHFEVHIKRRSVVGLGVMEYAGKYSVSNPSNGIYCAYLENLVDFGSWLLAHEYDVRLLIGDICDRPVKQQFMDLLKERKITYHETSIIDEPVSSVEQLLIQIATCDLVVATRFHNILFALVLGKPVMSIAFHHKCLSLMNMIGLSEYSHDINDLRADKLIERFRALEQDAENLRSMIKGKAGQLRKSLDEQYRLIFNEIHV
jgi:polysaccharide pyruvyl transferase WcaK-like protein